MTEEHRTPRFLQQTSIDEVHQIITALRGDSGRNDGDFRSSHLGIILEYLQCTKREDKKSTLAKLALKVGMTQRNVKENYFDGLIAFGIVKLTSNCNEWFWVGYEAITKHKGEL